MRSVPPVTHRGLEDFLSEKVVEEGFLADNAVDAANLDSQSKL